MGAEAQETFNGISDAAVRAKTGKGWREWFALLDAAGAAEMGHTAIAAHLYDTLGCPSWWSQMVAVGYEQARGLRQQNQACDGVFQVSVSKTVGVPLELLYAAWSDAKSRRRWLTENDFTMRKAIANKSLRITWVDGKTSVEINFYAKGADKSQVTIQHRKLPGAKAVPTTKAYWVDALARLKQYLEGDR
jgi:uncharacterized protein YndB with AHSA1/START domain